MCQMASISGKGEVAVNERGVGEQWKGFGLDSVDMGGLEIITDCWAERQNSQP